MRNKKQGQIEFEELLASVKKAKSRIGIPYTDIHLSDSKNRIYGTRGTTKNKFSIKFNELENAYEGENLESLSTLTNKKLKEKYGLSRAQSPAWAILKAVYKLKKQYQYHD